ncbi:MAG: hypothetical protein RLY14_947 [Planctomycetota bacterium]|jgi:2-polyprenyl-3-methyl-5-hydroxy-6-metoxy-1,4-benzoquinol methylase
MFELLQQKLGSYSRAVAINDFFSKPIDAYAENYDSVVYINVMEHVEDDSAEIRSACEALHWQ